MTDGSDEFETIEIDDLADLTEQLLKSFIRAQQRWAMDNRTRNKVAIYAAVYSAGRAICAAFPASRLGSEAAEAVEDFATRIEMRTLNEIPEPAGKVASA